MHRRAWACVGLVLFLLLLTLPWPAHAEQAEVELLCDTNGEPMSEGALIQYSQYTEGCRIDRPADLDTFTFAGTAGDVVRFRVRTTTPGLDARLELRGPDLSVLVDTFCSGQGTFGPVPCSISLDKALALTGTYRLSISDAGVNSSGGYILQVERIPPPFAPPGIPYDSPVPVRDVINPVTDTDFFTFQGAASTIVRIILSSITPGLDASLEIHAPDGSVLANTFCSGQGTFGPVLCSVSLDRALVRTGPYLVIVSDKGGDRTGGYELTVQCLIGGCAGGPNVTTFAINGGVPSTISRVVTLNNTATGSPTEYQASESQTFTGAAWTPYSTVPSFTLSALCGTKTVWFKVRNVLGESVAKSEDIELVIGSPVVTAFAINNGAPSTQTREVVLNSAATGCPTEYQVSESANFPNSMWLPYNGASSFTLSPGSGTKVVYLRVRNAAGVVSVPKSDSITLAPPTVVTFAINSGASSTTTRDVTLDNTATGFPTEYQASESSSFPNAIWLPYNAAPSFALSPVIGPKTVYFRVRNAVGMSPTKSDTITLSGPTVTFAINNGAPSTQSREVTLNNTATLSPTEYQASETQLFTGAAWAPYSTAPTFTLSQDIGAKTVYLRVRNAAGVVSVAKSDSITLSPPTVVTLAINNGATSTTTRDITLNNTTTGLPTEYQASASSSFTGAAWLPYTAAPTFTVAAGNGAKTVYFRVRNDIGTSPAKSDTITLSEPTPVVTTFAIDNGAASTASRQVTLNNTATLNPAEYQASTSPSFTVAAWLPYAPAPTFTLSAGNGVKTVYLRVRTAAGLVSTTKSDMITLIE